jgi:hypothetical protein
MFEQFFRHAEHSLFTVTRFPRKTGSPPKNAFKEKIDKPMLLSQAGRHLIQSRLNQVTKHASNRIVSGSDRLSGAYLVSV